MVRAKKQSVPSRIISTQLYTTVELAAFLRIDPRTLEAWRRLGTHPELKCTRVGRRIRYIGANILKFLSNNSKSRPKRKRRGAR
jgi:hypothetical protein